MFWETWWSSGLHGDWSCSVPSRGPLCSTWHAALNTQAIAGNSSSTWSEVSSLPTSLCHLLPAQSRASHCPRGPQGKRGTIARKHNSM
jgi:hypothetical protein